MQHISKVLVLILWMAVQSACAAQSDSDLQAAYAMGTKYELSNIDSAAYYFNIVDSLAFLENDSLMMTEAGVFFTSYYNVTEKPTQVERSFYRAYPYVRDTGRLLKIINSYGADQARRNVKKGDSILSIAIALIEQYDQPADEEGSIFNNYAQLQLTQGELARSAQYYLLALDHLDNPFGKFQTYLSLIGVFETMGNNQSMKAYIDKAIELSEKEGYKSRNGTLALYYAKYLIDTGDMIGAKQEIDKASNFTPIMHAGGFKKSLLITQKKYFSSIDDWQQFDQVLQDAAKDLRDYDLESHESILFFTAEADYHLGRFDMAKKNALKALKVAESDSRELSKKNIHHLLGQIYYKTGDYDLSVSHTMTADRMSESIYRNNQTQNINYLDGLFQKKETELKVAQLELENETKKAKLEYQRRQLVGGAIILGLISLLSFFLWRLYQQVNRQKQIISKTLEEKDILLREIHHRVKNNLQMVSSLLTLQGRSLDDHNAQQAIQEGKNRVRSMSLIHQDLYNKENLTDIGVKEYIEKLSHELLSTYRSDNLILKTNISDIDLDIDTMIPLGLIINELITNSLKYAFPDGRSGEISVSLLDLGDQLQLKIIDDGIGYDPRAIRENSFGTTLINALTDQLEGTLKTSSLDGTEISIVFSSGQPS